MTANAQRGEVEITLAGQTYTLRPTFEAVARIESRLNCGIFGLANRWIGRQDIGLAEASVVIEECIRGAGAKPPATVGHLIRKQGLTTFVVPLIKLVSNAISADEPQDPTPGEAPAVA